MSAVRAVGTTRRLCVAYIGHRQCIEILHSVALVPRGLLIITLIIIMITATMPTRAEVLVFTFIIIITALRIIIIIIMVLLFVISTLITTLHIT